MPDLRDPHSFPTPTNSEKLYKDDTVPGLFLRITFTGKRTWTFYRLLQGKPIKVKIADADALSLDEARVQARLLNAQLMTNPLTLEQLFDSYFVNHVLLHNARPKDIRRAFELHWQDLASMRVEEIATHHVQSWFTKLANISPSVANKELHRLRACINFAIDQDVIAPRKNPCRGVKALPDVERELYLKPEQMKRLDFEIGRIKESCTRDALRMFPISGAGDSPGGSISWENADVLMRMWNQCSGQDTTDHTEQMRLFSWSSGLGVERAQGLWSRLRQEGIVEQDWHSIFAEGEEFREIAAKEGALCLLPT